LALKAQNASSNALAISPFSDSHSIGNYRIRCTIGTFFFINIRLRLTASRHSERKHWAGRLSSKSIKNMNQYISEYCIRHLAWRVRSYFCAKREILSGAFNSPKTLAMPQFSYHAD
jgi:hypothetical protein